MTLTALSNGDILLVGVDVTYTPSIVWLTYSARSTDHGATFGTAASVGSTTIPDPASSGRPLEMPNGDLLLPIFGYQAGDTWWSSALMKSTDDGATWSDYAVIADGQTDADDYVEANLIRLDSGSLLCMIRRDNDSQIVRTTSANDGATWTTPHVAFAGTGRPSLVACTNGAVLCIYRNGGTGDATYRTSWTNGIGWEPGVVFDEGFRYVYGDMVEVATNEVACVYAMEESGGTDADLKQVTFSVWENA